MGLLQLIGPQEQSESDAQVLRRVSLVAAQLGRAILLRHEQELLMRSERMAVLGQAMGAMLHDLRTPLSAVASSVESMATAEAPEVRREHADRAGRSLEHVERMVQEVLAFARGQREVVADRLTLASFVEETRELLELELSRFGATLEIQGDCAGTGRFDAGKIKRVLWNLARNAGQAGAKKFTWKLERAGEYLVFECADTGPGIPQEMNGRLFEPFASHGKPKGTGLGLSMAKKIVDAHCGRIHVKSDLGRGTVFRIELPS
jgi:two-component system sensor histidine kinase FlrB